MRFAWMQRDGPVLQGTDGPETLGGVLKHENGWRALLFGHELPHGVKPFTQLGRQYAQSFYASRVTIALTAVVITL
jgi:hypothetical protein